MWVTWKVRMFQFAFIPYLCGNPSWTSVTAKDACLVVFTIVLSLSLVDPFSLLWLSQMRNYCLGSSPVLLSHLAYCFTSPLANTSGWLIICTSSTSFSKLREADVLFHTRKVFQKSHLISNLAMPITNFINFSWVCTRSFYELCYLEPLKSSWSVWFKHPPGEAALWSNTSPCWSKIACASLSVWFIKFITHKVRETRMERLKRDTEIWKSNA